MKRILILICTLLCANVLLAQTRFWIGDLQYEVTSTNPAEVEVYDANSSITTANIPSTVTYQETTYSVTTIERFAFYGCSSLTSVTIPENVTFIGEEAFRDCSSLTTLNFNAKNCVIYSIGIPCFSSSISTINIGDSVERIPAYFVSYCDNIVNIDIPNSVTSIGEEAFFRCYSLTSVTIPNSITSIGGWAFEFCSSLTSIDIPNSVTSIGNEAFSCCSSLTSITIPNSVTSIGGYAFANCSSLTSVTLGNGITSIQCGTFANCSSLTSITIPNSVTEIASPEGLGFSGAFEGCSSLTSVTFGESLAEIGERAFATSSFLQNITCLGTNPPILYNNSFPYPNIATLTVPCGSLEAYSATNSFWYMFFADRIEEDCTGLEDLNAVEISFFPNPTNSKVTFNQAIERIELMDLAGKTLRTYENESEINIEQLPAGVYYLRLTNNEKQSLRKLIKE